MRSHLQGMFFRTARMLESGMKPVYIFDGKPPEAKREELNRRFEKRGDATEELENMKEVRSSLRQRLAVRESITFGQRTPCCVCGAHPLQMSHKWVRTWCQDGIHWLACATIH